MPLNKHPFDQAFQQGLSGLEANPSPGQWELIAARLAPKPTQKFAAAVWAKYGIASALLVLLLWKGNLIFDILPNPVPDRVAETSVLAPVQSVAPLESVPANITIRSTGNQSLTHPVAMAGVTNLLASASRVAISPKPRGSNRQEAIAGLSETNTRLAAKKVNAATEASRVKLAGNQVGLADPVEVLPKGLGASALPTSAELQLLPSNRLEPLTLNFASILGPDLPCPTFGNEATWTVAVRALVGPGYTTRDFKKVEDIQQQYLSLRESIETLQTSVHAGLRVEAVNSKGLFLRVGADYQMYRSRVNFLGPLETRTTIVDVQETPGGPIVRTDTVIERFRRERITYNRHQTMAIVAGVGFRKTFERLSPYFMAEVGFEFLLKSRGLLPRQSGELVELPEPGETWIYKSPGLQYGGVLGVDYALTERLEIGLSGHYKKLGGLRGEADALDYKQSSAYGAINVRYSF